MEAREVRAASGAEFWAVGTKADASHTEFAVRTQAERGEGVLGVATRLNRANRHKGYQHKHLMLHAIEERIL